MLAEDLDEGGEAGVVDQALAGGGGVEVDDIDDALEGWVLAGDGAGGVGEELAEAGSLLLDLGPAGERGM